MIKAKLMMGLAALSVAAPLPTVAIADGSVTVEQAAAHADNGKHKGHYKNGKARGYYGDDRRYYNDRYDRYDRRDDRRYRDQRVSRNTRVWRDNGRTYCRRNDGTTGLLIGGAAGAVLGAEVAGRQDRTLGAIIGAVGGGLLGRSLDRGELRCR